MTIKQAADTIGISERTLGSYERGKTPPFDVVQALAEVYGASLDSFADTAQKAA